MNWAVVATKQRSVVAQRGRNLLNGFPSTSDLMVVIRWTSIRENVDVITKTFFEIDGKRP